MARMRGGSNAEAVQAFIVYFFIIGICAYYAVHAPTKTGRITAMVFGVVFGIFLIGMTAEVYGMWKSGSLLSD